MTTESPKKRTEITFLSGLGDTFHFHCKACGQCCGHYRIILSPYDILRLRKATGRKTHELIACGTVQIVRESFKHVFGFAPLADVFDSFGLSRSDTIPVALLAFRPDNACRNVCEFLSPAENGKRLCTIYRDRPTMCRLHPLGCTTVAGKRLWFFRRPLCEPDASVTQKVVDWVRASHLQPYLKANFQYLQWMLALMAQSEYFDRISEQHWSMLEKILFDFDCHDATMAHGRATALPKSSSGKTRAPSMHALDGMFHHWLSDVRNHID